STSTKSTKLASSGPTPSAPPLIQPSTSSVSQRQFATTSWPSPSPPTPQPPATTSSCDPGRCTGPISAISAICATSTSNAIPSHTSALHGRVAGRRHSHSHPILTTNLLLLLVLFLRT